jgi:hypothetical protein
MTAYIREAARICLVLVFVVAPVFVAVSSPPVSAQSNGPKGDVFVLYPDGVVDTHQLPPPAQDAGAVGNAHRHFPDENLLALQKAGAYGHAGGPTTAGILPSGSPLTTTTAPNVQGLRQSESGGWYPPDTQVAAGPSHILEAVNLEVRVWEKGTRLVLSNYTICSLFGRSCSSLSDPKVRFDPISQRWFVVVINYKITGSWLIAVSTDSTPTTFVRYQVNSASGTFPDFPGLGMSQDKVVLTGNAFRSGNKFSGAEFVVLNKAQLVAGTTVSGTFFGPLSNAYTIQPAFSLPTSGGSTTTNTLYMADVGYNVASSVRVWSVTGVPGPSPVSYVTTSLTIPSLSTPPNAPQLGTTALIATNDNALLDAAYRNGALWVSASSACTPSGDTAVRACLRFMQISTFPVIQLVQAPDFGDIGKYYYYPAIQLDVNNNLVTVFSGSSTSSYASVYAGGQPAGATATFKIPALIKAGEAAYTPNRWGDYSGAGIDPSGTAVWIAGEYALKNSSGSAEWGTWVAEVGF